MEWIGIAVLAAAVLAAIWVFLRSRNPRTTNRSKERIKRIKEKLLEKEKELKEKSKNMTDEEVIDELNKLWKEREK